MKLIRIAILERSPEGMSGIEDSGHEFRQRSSAGGGPPGGKKIRANTNHNPLFLFGERSIFLAPSAARLSSPKSDADGGRATSKRQCLSLKFRTLLLVFALALLLAGCASEPVAKDINQLQANEIVALLNSQGISATAQKESGAAGRYSVNVDSSALTPAIALLNDRGLPRKSRFAELIQPQGLIPNSREMEALRVDYARATEIEELLESHPAVSSAAVTLSRGDLGQEGASGVAVIVNQRSGRAISHAEVSEIVSRLIPGIKPENIALSIHAVDANGNLFNVEGAVNQGGKVIRMPLVPFLFGWRVAEDDFSALALAVLSLLLVVALLAAFLGYSYGAYRSGASDFRVSLPEPAVKSGRLDRPNPELPEE